MDGGGGGGGAGVCLALKALLDCKLALASVLDGLWMENILIDLRREALCLLCLSFCFLLPLPPLFAALIASYYALDLVLDEQYMWKFDAWGFE